MERAINLQHPLRLGEAAPEFWGLSTHGSVKLTDYRGKWLVFFAYPADFTPVCTSEFVELSKHSADFRALNCSLLGLSVDSIATHAMWRGSIRREFGADIDFPILEDASLQIARLYNMVAAGVLGAGTVRALFIIDPAGVLRAMTYYPCATGRSVAEVLRLVRALQATNLRGTLTPEGWQPGMPTFAAGDIVAHPRDEQEFGCVEWYCYPRPAIGGPSHRIGPAPTRPANADSAFAPS